jgi:hypothetical protein
MYEPRLISRCLRIGPTSGRLVRSPDSRSRPRTVWPDIWTFAKPGVLRAVSWAVIIRLHRWIRRTSLSWRCDLTRGLPLLGLSFVLPVCRGRITSIQLVILDTLKWYATGWWVMQDRTISTTRSVLFWRSRVIDVLMKFPIFRMTNCLLLLIAQLMTTCDLNG